jgi:hypothetical protein
LKTANNIKRGSACSFQWALKLPLSMGYFQNNRTTPSLKFDVN